jgi:hypothetical protein
MNEQNNELTYIDIDKLLDGFEAEFQRKNPDERQADQEKFRLEHSELCKEVDAIFAEFEASKVTSFLAVCTPKEVLLETLTKHMKTESIETN